MRTSQRQILGFALLLFLFAGTELRADSATWNLNPVSNDWNNAANWTPATVPGFGNTATFDVSNTTSISVPANTLVRNIVFNPGASAYTITGGNNFQVFGGSITNNSGITQTFTGFISIGLASVGPNSFVGTLTQLPGANAGNSKFTGASILFLDNANAANATVTPTFRAEFSETSSAGSAVFTNNGATVAGGQAAYTRFTESSNPDNGTFINNGSTVPGADGGLTEFATSGNPPFTGTIIANGGTNGGSGGRVRVSGSHFDGGTGRLIVSSGATFDMSPVLDFVGITMGSIEGGGDFYLGSRQLKVGANNLNTIVSGALHDAGQDHYYIGGSLDKTGTGTLTLTGASSYTGSTIVESGTLDAEHVSALGPGNIAVVNPGAVLTLANATGLNTNPSDTATLSIVSGCTVNLNFSSFVPRRIASLVVDGVVQPFGLYGSAASGAPHQLPEFAGLGKLLVNGPIAVSRKNHGGSIFDIPLTLHGTMAVEPRSSPNNAYQIVITYANPVTFSGAAVTYGPGMVTGVSGNGTSTVTVDLAGVTNAQAITVTVYGLNDGFTTKDLPIRMVILIGDVAGPGFVEFVNASDISAVKTQVGHPVSASNFRADINANGSINASDVAAVKAKSGTAYFLTPTEQSGPGISARPSGRP